MDGCINCGLRRRDLRRDPLRGEAVVSHAALWLNVAWLVTLKAFFALSVGNVAAFKLVAAARAAGFRYRKLALRSVARAETQLWGRVVLAAPVGADLPSDSESR